MHKIERNTNIDKTKGLLIFLVVFGHFIERYMGWHNDISAPLLKFIYTIHMPAFIFIAGTFFKIENWRDNFYRYFSIFLVFQALYILFDYSIDGGAIYVWLNKPYWIMWFMFTLSIYCLITPLLIKHKMALLISIGLSIYIGLVATDNYPFSIGRTLSFLPFFIFGVLYGRSILDFLSRKSYLSILSILILTILGLLSYFLEVKSSWLFGVANINDYSNLLSVVFIKISLLIISLMSLLSVIKLSEFLPRFFEYLGKKSLSIYLFHGFIVILMSRYVDFSQPDYVLILVCLAASLGICLVFKENIFEITVNRLSKSVMSIFK